MFAVVRSNSMTNLLNLNQGKFIRNLTPSNSNLISAITKGYNNNYKLYGLDNGYVSLWDYALSKKYKSHVAHKEPITSLKLSNCSQYYVTTSKDNSVILWSLKSNIALRKFYHGKQVTSIEFSPDSK